MKTPTRPRLSLDRETIAPLLLDRVTGGGITDVVTVTTATTSTTALQTRWCKTGK